MSITIKEKFWKEKNKKNNLRPSTKNIDDIDNFFNINLVFNINIMTDREKKEKKKYFV